MKTLNVVLILMSLLVAPGAALAQSGVTGSWVTTDFAIGRGWFQGYPKKLGSAYRISKGSLEEFLKS